MLNLVFIWVTSCALAVTGHWLVTGTGRISLWGCGVEAVEWKLHLDPTIVLGYSLLRRLEVLILLQDSPPLSVAITAALPKAMHPPQGPAVASGWCVCFRVERLHWTILAKSSCIQSQPLSWSSPKSSPQRKLLHALSEALSLFPTTDYFEIIEICQDLLE